MLQEIAKFIKKVIGNVEIDVQIEIEGSDTLAWEIDFSLVASLTENEVVWSSFYDRAFPVGKLQFSHYDSNGVAGYKVAGSNLVLWRDQLTYAEYVA